MQASRAKLSAAISICAAFLVPLPSPAQESDVPETDVITVEAPRSGPALVERNPYTGAAIVVTTVKMPVMYDDLDLATPRDADRLMVRIRSVARDLCKHLDRLMPLNPDPTCIQQTVAKAASQASAVIAAARQRSNAP